MSAEDLTLDSADAGLTADESTGKGRRRETARIHTFLSNMAEFDVRPALCGFVLTPSRAIPTGLVDVEYTYCARCEEVSLEIAFHRS